jgi:RNA polymerase sigma factor (TIGR02999 family)
MDRQSDHADRHSTNQITEVLRAIEGGDSKASAELLPLVYDELRRVAARRFAKEKPGQTLQVTALVHEAYLRLLGPLGQDEPQWNSTGHFFMAAAEAMRRILIESARHKKRLRHGGNFNRVDLDRFDVADQSASDELLALDEALDRLAAEDPIVADVVKLRYFAGLTIEQAAEYLGVSVRTANRHWSYAKAWLFEELSK